MRCSPRSGRSGTVMVPTFTYDSARFDPGATPGRTGAVAEALRRRAGAVRSLHPFYSVAAFGPRGVELTRGHELLPGTGIGSPLDRLAAAGGLILLLGVGHDRSTTIHVGEFRAGAFYLDIPFDPAWPTTAEIVTGDETRRVSYDRFPGCSRVFGVIEPHLRARGAIEDGPVGRAERAARRRRGRDRGDRRAARPGRGGAALRRPRLLPLLPGPREARAPDTLGGAPAGCSRPSSGSGSRSMIASIASSGTAAGPSPRSARSPGAGPQPSRPAWRSGSPSRTGACRTRSTRSRGASPRRATRGGRRAPRRRRRRVDACGS